MLSNANNVKATIRAGQSPTSEGIKSGQGKHHALPQLVRTSLCVQSVLEKYGQKMNVVHSRRGDRVIDIRVGA